MDGEKKKLLSRRYNWRARGVVELEPLIYFEHAEGEGDDAIMRD